MARTVLPIVGALVGGYFGGPTGAQLGWAAGAAIGGAVDPVINKGPKIGDIQAQTAQEGAFRTVVFGTYPVYGNVLCTGPGIKSTEIESGEGKGGPKNEVEKVYRNFAIRICEAIPNGKVLRVWEFDKLKYDIRAGSLMLQESAKWKKNKVFYMGGEDQLPDVFLELNVSGVGETPAYRDSCYMVVGLEDQTDTRGAIAQYRFEVADAVSTQDLTVIPTIGTGMIGGGGGGSYVTGAGAQFSGTLDGVRGPGEVYLATFGFDATFVPGDFTIYMKIGGVEIWSRNATLNVGESFTAKTQMNHPADGSLFAIGFVAGGLGFSGNFTFRIQKPDSADIFTAFNAGDEPPLITEADSPYFGVLVGEDGDLYSGGTTTDGFTWGPTTFEKAEGQPMPLSEIVSAIHERCDYPSEGFDVSELDDLVTGFGLAGDFSGGSAIAVLQGPYNFDKSSHDGKLWYPKRGGPIQHTFTINDLVELPDTAQREQAIEYPAKLHLFYQHAASGYAVVKATSTRSSPDVKVVGEISMQVPIVLNEDQAAQMAAKQHKIAWVEAGGEVTYSVPESFLKYTAADVLALSLRGRVERLRLAQTNHADGVIGYTLKKDRQSAYTSDLTGVPIPPPSLPPSTIVGETVLAVLDVSSRQDSEDDLNILYAVTGGLPAWYGAAVQRSDDGGANFSTIVNIDRAGLIGRLTANVAAASEYFTDTTNTVSVDLIRDGQVIDDISETEFLSEGGAFALEKADGSWEIMQYRDVSRDSSGAFILSTLHRGLLNSGASAHSVDALFVMMRSPTHVAMPSSLIGAELVHRAVSYSESAEGADEQSDIYYGRSQIEWPVASFALSRTGDVVTGTWAPRHRFGTDDAPVASINFTGYRVSIVGTSTVSFDVTVPTFTYDVSAIGGAVTVSVSSLNRITGAGPSTSGAI